MGVTYTGLHMGDTYGGLQMELPYGGLHMGLPYDGFNKPPSREFASRCCNHCVPSTGNTSGRKVAQGLAQGSRKLCSASFGRHLVLSGMELGKTTI